MSSGLEGYRKRGFKRDAELERCWIGVIQAGEMQDRWDAEKEECRNRERKEKRDAGQEGLRSREAGK